MLICGEQDALTPPLVMKDMFHKINKAEFVEVPNAGHMTPIENPQMVNKANQRFSG